MNTNIALYLIIKNTRTKCTFGVYNVIFIDLNKSILQKGLNFMRIIYMIDVKDIL
jgi:hypothetical protein